MTITIFVEPKSLYKFLETTTVLRDLPLENDYVFQPLDLSFSETMISNYLWINVDISEYMKLKYCITKLTAK